MPIHPDACPGSCNRAARNTWNAYEQAILNHADAVDAWARNGERGDPPAEPEAPQIVVRYGDPRFCGGCRARIHAALLDLDQMASELQAVSDGHRGGVPGERVSHSRASGSPSPTAVLLDSLYGFLADVEDEWRDTWGYTRRTDRIHRGAHPRTRRITWLEERLDSILAAEEHTTFGLDVLRWEVVLRERLKEDSVGIRSPIRCPRRGCDERRVVRQKAGHWQCEACTMVLSDPVERQERDKQGVELIAQEAS